MNGTVYDIYGHDGTEEHPYQISTAYQLLSFAYEVQGGRSFEGQYVSLDADITFEVAWIGIGNADSAFNGVFLGGHRFVYGIKDQPLFYSLGAKAKVEQLQVSAGGTVSLGGLFAASDSGTIEACFFNKTLLPSSDANGYTSAEMTKQAFTDALNAGLTAWRTSHSSYDNHYYVHQPANYPRLNE